MASVTFSLRSQRLFLGRQGKEKRVTLLGRLMVQGKQVRKLSQSPIFRFPLVVEAEMGGSGSESMVLTGSEPWADA